jgi:hypothetical protein
MGFWARVRMELWTRHGWGAIRNVVQNLGIGRAATTNYKKEVYEGVDWLASVADQLASVSIRGGEVRTSAGDGEDIQNSVKGDVLLFFHEGLQQSDEITTKSRVVLESGSEGQEVERRSEIHVIGTENMLDLFDVAVVAVENG